MRNIHERVLDAPAEIVGGMLDRIGSDEDVLWPSQAWPPMISAGASSTRSWMFLITGLRTLSYGP